MLSKINNNLKDYNDNTKNVLPLNYPSKINNIKPNYININTNNYWTNSLFSNYPSLWVPSNPKTPLYTNTFSDGTLTLPSVYPPLISPITYNGGSLNISININKFIDIPESPAGFSFEIVDAHKVLANQDGSPRKSFKNLMNLLRNTSQSSVGPTIRIGAYTGENTVFSNIAAGNTETSNLSHLDYRCLETYKYVNLFNGQLIAQVPIHTNDAVYASNYAVAVKNIVGDTGLRAIECGNEPDLTSIPNTITYVNYLSNYVSALNKVVGTKIMVGSFASMSSLFNNFNSTYKINFTGKVDLYSIHHYNNPTGGIQGLLKSNEPTKNPSAFQISNKGYILGETNMANFGRIKGLKLTGLLANFGTGLWSLDYCLYRMSTGYSNLYFHGGPTSSESTYSTFAFLPNEVRIHPLFYGVWMFNYAIRNKAYLCNQASIVGTSKSSIKVYVLKNNDEINVVVIHNDFNKDNIQINIPYSTTKYNAKLLRLVNGSNNVNQAYGNSLGGLTLDRSIDGKPYKYGTTIPSNDFVFESVSNINNTYTFIIGKLTAVVLTIPLIAPTTPAPAPAPMPAPALVPHPAPAPAPMPAPALVPHPAPAPQVGGFDSLKKYCSF